MATGWLNKKLPEHSGRSLIINPGFLRIEDGMALD
jgi:hypothetical protein